MRGSRWPFRNDDGTSPRSPTVTLLSEFLARGAVPNSIRDIVRIGRLTVLQKPSGGVRGIVAGDVIRRVVARTIAQQINEAVEAATASFQYAFTTIARCEMLPFYQLMVWELSTSSFERVC